MGNAKRRGSFEVRKAEAELRKAEEMRLCKKSERKFSNRSRLVVAMIYAFGGFSRFK